MRAPSRSLRGDAAASRDGLPFPSTDSSGRHAPLTVLHVIHGLSRGGTETSLLLLCRHLDRRRVVPIVCCLDEGGPLVPEFEALGVEVVALRRTPGLRPDTLRRLAGVLRARRPDLVHAHGWPASFWSRLATAITGTRPLVVTEHGDNGTVPRRRAVVDTVLGPACARVVTVSRALATAYRLRVWIPADRVEVIPNGVDCDELARRFDPEKARARLDVPRSAPTVGIIARLHPVKRHEVFLAAVAALQRQLPGVLALVVGDGSERAAIEARAASLGIAGSVRLLGERSDIPDILGAIDVLMLTSRNEGCPMAALEAMAAGIALVAPRIPPLLEITDEGDAAELVPPGDAQAFAAAALHLLRDERRRAALAATERDWARRNYDIRGRAGRFTALYEAIVRPHRRTGSDLHSSEAGR